MDNFRAGQSLIVAHCPSLLCPVSARQQFFLQVKPCLGPLFYFWSGCYLTRTCHALTLGFNKKPGPPAQEPHESQLLNRAASAAAAVTMPDWLIKVLVHWLSD